MLRTTVAQDVIRELLMWKILVLNHEKFSLTLRQQDTRFHFWEKNALAAGRRGEA
jgi:hypothetical protein